MLRTTAIIALLCLQTVPLASTAADIRVGERVIDIPTPTGFVEVTPDMSPYYELLGSYVAPTNARYVTLIGADQANALLRGEDVELTRYLNLETIKEFRATSISSSDFKTVRNAYRSRIADLYTELEKKLPGMFDEANKAATESLAVEIAIEVEGMVPLPIHEETDNSIANSMMMTVGGAVAGGDIDNHVTAATSLVLHVKDKVLFLYAYGSESDLDWTRRTAAEWAKDIRAANPLSADELSAIDRKTSTGIDWNSVVGKALAGAIFGGVIGLFALFFKKLNED